MTVRTTTTPPVRLSLLGGLLFFVGGSCTHNPAYYAEPLPPPAAKLVVATAPTLTEAPVAAAVYQHARQQAAIALAAPITARWENGDFYKAARERLAAERTNALCALEQAEVAHKRQTVSSCTLVAVPAAQHFETTLHFPIGVGWARQCTAQATPKRPCQEGVSSGLSENLSRWCLRVPLGVWGTWAVNTRVAAAQGLEAGQLACAYEGKTGVAAWTMLDQEQQLIAQDEPGAAALKHRHKVLASDANETLAQLKLTLGHKFDLLQATQPTAAVALDPAVLAAILDLMYTQEDFVKQDYAPGMWTALANANCAAAVKEIRDRSALGATKNGLGGLVTRRQAAAGLIACKTTRVQASLAGYQWLHGLYTLANASKETSRLRSR